MNEPQPNRRGCFIWGCLTGLISLISIGSYMWVTYNRLCEEFTSPTAHPIPLYGLKPGEYERVEKKLSGFGQPAEAGKPLPLELTADELNALIAGHPVLKDLAGKVSVKILGDRLLLDVSIPLDAVPLPSLKNRFFNGTLATKFSLKDGRLSLDLESATVRDKPVPKNLLMKIRTAEFFKEEITLDENLRDLLRKVVSFEVREGKLIVERNEKR